MKIRNLSYAFIACAFAYAGQSYAANEHSGHEGATGEHSQASSPMDGLEKSEIAPMRQPHRAKHPHGAHKHADHGKRTMQTVARHAKVNCDIMAHNFVPTLSHKQFLHECHGSHHHVLTHVRPHPDAGKE